jgi:predicted nucleotidyltransferase component of viral defense system
MLYLETVEPGTFQLLKDLMAAPSVRDFSLVGGTCLSLRHGHRKSIDLDLFGTENFDNDTLKESLEQDGFRFTETFYTNRLGVFGFLNGIKVDFVRHHQYPMLRKIEVVDGIRMFSDQDIMAMKVSAILRRAVKKDFWDVAELLRTYSMDDFVESYYAKYSDNLLLISIPRALSYFDDAELSPDPECLRGLSWDEVKSIIRKAVREYLS